MRSNFTDSSRRRSKRSLPLHLLGGVLGAMLAVFMPLMDAQARRAVVLNVDGAIGPYASGEGHGVRSRSVWPQKRLGGA